MSNIRVTIAVHWEGRHLDGVEALAEARRRLLPGVPVTHFVSAAYFSRGGDIEGVAEAMLPAFESNDEVALHVPAWQSLRGSSQPPNITVIAGEDPELVVEYPGITSQADRGYTHPVSAYSRPAIEAFIVSSKLLLRPLLQALVVKRRVQVERMLKGIRAGHGMASDVFLAAALNTGFQYDASAMDAVWARALAERREGDGDRANEPFVPLWRAWSRLWGAQECREPHLSNHGMLAGTGGAGVGVATHPFFIARRGQERLLEMPLTGGVLPPATPQHMAQLLINALEAPPGLPRIVSVAIRQETAEGSLDALVRAEALRSSRIQWTTNVDLLPALLGTAPVPEPRRAGPLQQVREQLAAGQVPTIPTIPTMPSVAPPSGPVTPPPVPTVPAIQVPPIVVPPIRS